MGEPAFLLGISEDIMERKQVEARLFQSQKLETVGTLAGGIAHEFNSILTAIIGRTELIMSDFPDSHPVVQNAAEIRKGNGLSRAAWRTETDPARSRAR
jgi:signal transduction histidine kinase